MKRVKTIYLNKGKRGGGIRKGTAAKTNKALYYNNIVLRIGIYSRKIIKSGS